MSYSVLNDTIKQAKSILIISHVNPDGDTLGSMCGLYCAIEENFKKKCDMMVLSKVPAVYEFLPNINKAKSLDEFDRSRVYDLAITVDVAGLDRTLDGRILFKKALKTINIDHHKTTADYADINIIDPDASSAGEILYGIMKESDWKIGSDTAINLYTAVLTDTGSFRFENTKPSTFETAAELVKIGAEPARVYRNVYESDTKATVLFQAYCIGKAEFLEDDKIAYTIVYKKDMEKFNAGDDAMEGMTEKLRAIVTTRIAFVVKEMKSGGSKVSMRSKSADAAQICAVFGGGGHKFAAGCTIKAAPEQAAKKILAEIKKLKVL